MSVWVEEQGGLAVKETIVHLSLAGVPQSKALKCL